MQPSLLNFANQPNRDFTMNIAIAAILILVKLSLDSFKLNSGRP
jgi:hypothetical protein